MKKISFYLSAIVLSIVLASCDFNKKENLAIEEDFELVKVSDYGIHIPNYMKKADNLNDDASLQYQNIFKETYVIVIDESKEEFIDAFKELDMYDESVSVVKNYREIQMGSLTEAIQVKSQSAPRSVNINGLEAELVEIDGHAEGVTPGIAYFLAFIEGDDNVYMIMAWTLLKRKDKYRDTFEKTIQSFRLLDSSSGA